MTNFTSIEQTSTISPGAQVSSATDQVARNTREMRHHFFAVIFLLCSLGAMSQDLFKVIEVKRNAVCNSQAKNDSLNSYFRIVLSADTMGASPAYPIRVPQDIDTLKAIVELLRYKGDARLCVFPIRNYNPARSQIYLGENENYSIQVEALFIINQLVYKQPFNYSSYPILVDKKTDRQYCISGAIVSGAFRAYKNWYKELREKGIGYITERNIMPLDGSPIRWY